MFNLLRYLFGFRSSAAELVTEKSPDADRRSLADLPTTGGNSDAEPPVVAFDEKEIYCTFKTSAGEAGTVKWSELQEVGILTTTDGPLTNDLFWILSGENGSCVVPGQAVGCDRLLGRLQQLSSFNNMEVIRAMGSTSQARFVCWRRRK
jgi:hypothetical protein